MNMNGNYNLDALIQKCVYGTVISFGGAFASTKLTEIPWIGEKL